MIDYDDWYKEMMDNRIQPTPYTRKTRPTPVKTNDLYVFADFNSRLSHNYSGLRNMNLINGIYDSLAEEYNVIKCDVGDIPQEELDKHNNCTGAHHLVGQVEGANIFVIQPSCAIINGLGFSKTIYFHIDGAETIGIKRLYYAFKIYNDVGGYDYPLSPQFKHLYPFVFLDRFNPNREKDITISCIDRFCSFAEYKDLLERSQFTVIDCRGFNPRKKFFTFTSKRVFQALACKTIPIIIGESDTVYKKFGIDDSIAMFMNHKIGRSYIAYKYDLEMVNRGYELMKACYSGKKRMKIIKAVCRRIYNSG